MSDVKYNFPGIRKASESKCLKFSGTLLKSRSRWDLILRSSPLVPPPSGGLITAQKPLLCFTLRYLLPGYQHNIDEKDRSLPIIATTTWPRCSTQPLIRLRQVGTMVVAVLVTETRPCNRIYVKHVLSSVVKRARGCVCDGHAGNRDFSARIKSIPSFITRVVPSQTQPHT